MSEMMMKMAFKHASHDHNNVEEESQHEKWRVLLTETKDERDPIMYINTECMTKGFRGNGKKFPPQRIF